MATDWTLLFVVESCSSCGGLAGLQTAGFSSLNVITLGFSSSKDTTLGSSTADDGTKYLSGRNVFFLLSYSSFSLLLLDLSLCALLT